MPQAFTGFEVADDYSIPVRDRAAINSFDFNNSFINHEYFQGIHISTDGRCGGMSYAANDFFRTGQSIPTRSTRPPDGSNLARYIYNRQLDSLTSTATKWIERVMNPAGAGDYFTAGIQMNRELGIVTESIDRGEPIVLCLFPTDWNLMSNPGHQVLAFGYSLPDVPSDLTDLLLYIYDPNYRRRVYLLYPHVTRGVYYQIRLEQLDRPENQRTFQKVWANYFADTGYQVQQYDNDLPQVPNLSYLDLSGHDFGGRNLVGAQCVETNFNGANLHRSDLSGANLTGASFSGANLSNANLEGSTLSGANFVNADMKSATLDSCELTNGATFLGANLGNARLRAANLGDSNLQGVVLSMANLRESEFNQAIFEHGDLNGANFDSAQLIDCDFTNAILRNAILKDANLTESNFSGADLASMNLQGASVTARAGLWLNVKNGLQVINPPPTLIPFL